MISNQQIKILIDSQTFDDWKKNSGLEPYEAMRWWNRFKWNISKDDKEFLKQYEEKNKNTDQSTNN